MEKYRCPTCECEWTVYNLKRFKECPYCLIDIKHESNLIGTSREEQINKHYFTNYKGGEKK